MRTGNNNPKCMTKGRSNDTSMGRDVAPPARVDERPRSLRTSRRASPFGRRLSKSGPQSSSWRKRWYQGCHVSQEWPALDHGRLFFREGSKSSAESAGSSLTTLKVLKLTTPLGLLSSQNFLRVLSVMIPLVSCFR